MKRKLITMEEFESLDRDTLTKRAGVNQAVWLLSKVKMDEEQQRQLAFLWNCALESAGGIVDPGAYPSEPVRPHQGPLGSPRGDR
ncbi:MAG: hypothetical protein ACPGQD_03730 [Planctomycetota bacterium]